MDQSLDEDLELIDHLFGRDGLRYGDGPERVKAEALRQLRVGWGRLLHGGAMPEAAPLAELRRMHEAVSR